MASPGAGSPERARVAVVGISLNRTCGVRDHAELLFGALAAEGVDCSWHWLQRHDGSLRSIRGEVHGWARELAHELGSSRPHAILLHYSVFSYAYKGVPVFVKPVLSALAKTGTPIVTVLHEYAYRWTADGWRGKTWALTQRAQLIAVMRASAAAVVTAEPRAAWLASRPWLPKRRVLVAPVFSNLPASQVSAPAPRDEPVLGLFGYAYQGAEMFALVLDAIAELHGRGIPLRVLLLGAPGPSSAAGELWLAHARRRGLADALAFSGRLPAQELADALAGCDVLLFADTAGPTSRKGTLAGSLASGRPLVAVDGPQRWPAPVEAGALAIAAPQPRALADVLAGLLGDRAEREALGARGRAFAERVMGIGRTAEAVNALVAELRRQPLAR